MCKPAPRGERPSTSSLAMPRAEPFPLLDHYIDALGDSTTMSQPQLLSEGLTLMTYGMGFVFCFLTLLVGVTTLMSKIINRYFPQPAPVKVASPAQSADDPELVAVITAAVRQYRSRR